MKTINTLNAIIISTIFILVCACGKEKEEITPREYTSPSFDEGYLLVMVTDFPHIVDSILYINHTKGVVNNLNLSSLQYHQSSHKSLLAMPLANGNKNDQVECCVYLNVATNLSISFEEIPPDSVLSNVVTSSPFCLQGNY